MFSLRKLALLKVLLLIFIILIITFNIYTLFYSVANYNQIKLYELSSINKNFKIDGFLLLNKNQTYLTINNLTYIQEDNLFLNDKTSKFKWYISYKNNINIHKTLIYDEPKKIYDIFNTFSYYTAKHKIINYKEPISVEFSFEYINEKNEIIKNNFNIQLTKKYSNNKIFY